MLALTAALVAPYFVDWSSYRAQFEREAGRVLGREVTVEGTARVRLLPFPSVTFTDVSVAGRGGDDPAMTVEEFSMDAELAPLLRGEVLIFDMQLVRPVVSVKIGKGGGIDWAVRPSSPFDPRQVTLENVSVSDGSIIIRHAESGRVHRVSGINASLSARTLAGPWHIDGAASLDGMRTALSISTGTLGEDGRLRVRVDARPEPYPLTLKAAGDARFEDGKAVYGGEFRIQTRVAEAAADEGSNQAAFPVAQRQEADDARPGNRLHGTFSLDSERLVIDRFRFETGPADNPYTADGEARVTLGADPHFSISADGAQIRFGGPAATAAGKIAGMSPDERFSALSAFVTELPRPGMPGTVKVNLPAIVTGDTTIRNVRLSASPAGIGWKIESAAAMLPGRAQFEGKGLLSTVDELKFTGNLLLAVKQPSGFAAWLARDVDDAIRRLPAAGFSAEVKLTRRQQIFDNFELILGDARFRGRIARTEPADARPSLDVSLDGERLDVEGMTAFASIFVSEDGVNRLADHDVDLHIRAGPVEAAGLTATSLNTELRLRQGNLEIDKLRVGGLADASVSATGTINDFSGAPTGKIDATILSVDLAPLVSTLAGRFPDNRLITALDERARNYPGLLEDAEINVIASAADNGDRTTGMAISAQGVAGGTSFSFAGSGNGLLTHPKTASFSVDFSGRNDEAAALYALYGIPGIPLGLAGGAKTEFSARGTLKGGLETSLSFTGDGLEATFDGTAGMRDGKPAIEGRAQVSSADVQPWLAAAAVALPGFGYGLPVELHGDVKYSDGRVEVRKLTGDVAGSAVAGDLNAELMEGMPHITGSLDVEYLDARFAVAMVVGEPAIESFEGGDWPRRAFTGKANPPFTADMTLGARTLSAGASPSLKNARMTLQLNEDGLRVSGLSARLFGGSLEGLAELTNNAGTGLLSAQFSLNGTPLTSLFAQGGLKGQADVSATVTASGKSVEGMVAALAGSGSASLRNLVIAGINPDAFASILERADAIGRDIDAADTAAFAPAIVRDGVFRAGAADIAFTLADGVARTPPVRLEGDRLVLTADSRLDLKAMTAHVDGAIVYNAGEDELAGSEPTVRFTVDGPLDSLETSLGTQPLAQYLTQRALEKEQARVEHMQAVLLENQRLRRETHYYAALQDRRRRAEMERRRFDLETERARERTKAKAEEARRRQEQADEAAARAGRGRDTPGAADEEDSTRPGAARGDKPAATSPQTDGGSRPGVLLLDEPGGTSAGGNGDGIERSPLPPPGETSGDAARKRDDEVSRYFRSEDLTIDGLLKLIRPQQ